MSIGTPTSPAANPTPAASPAATAAFADVLESGRFAPTAEGRAAADAYLASEHAAHLGELLATLERADGAADDQIAAVYALIEAAVR
jgi:hypothetical protein